MVGDSCLSEIARARQVHLRRAASPAESRVGVPRVTDRAAARTPESEFAEDA
jgi:hypothetical protein